MSNWSLPTLSSLYTDFLAFLKARDDDAVRLNDSRTTAATNLPDYAKRWNATLGTFQNWLSSAWGNIVMSIAGGGTGASDAATARTNLDVFSKGEGDGRYETPSGSTAKVATHAALTDAHGATSGPTASRIVMRDSNGQAAIAAPSSSNHIAIKQTVDDHAALGLAHAATPDIVISSTVGRDAGGRFKANAPYLQDQVATKGYVDGLLVSGTYTPSITAVANVSASEARECSFTRVGNFVQVSGILYLTPTTGGITSIINLSLPIASDFSQLWHCAGIANASWGNGVQGAFITADAANNKASMEFSVLGAGNHLAAFSFTYWVL